MELTTTMSDRQKLAATVIIAQTKLREPDTHRIKDMDESQGEIQKHFHAHYAVLKDVFQFIDICGHTWRMISVHHPR